MANPHKGEVDFTADGKKYILCFSANAICALEDHLDRGVFAITQELQSWAQPTRMVEGKSVPAPETPEQTSARNGRVRMSFCRSVFWSCFIEHHPDVTIEQVGSMMVEAGGLIGTLNLLSRVMALAMPKQDEGDSPSHPRQRRPARNGTGRAS